MANATNRVQMATTPWGDDKVERPLAATAAVYYPGAMIALDASGNAVKCDDATPGLKFDGLNAETVRVQVFSGESAGDRHLKVERPFGFTMSIAAAAAGDERKPVYALYDNEVAYSTVNGILVGWVDKVLSATSVFIRPVWLGPPAPAVATLAGAGSTQGDAAAIAAEVTQVTGADGTVGVVLPAAVPGLRRYVYNTHASNGLKIYPASGDDINDGTTNAAVTIEGKTLATFVALDNTTWAAQYTANS